MTLSTLTSRISYPGAGSVGPFPFPFRIRADADLLVTRRASTGAETRLTLTTHYTVSGALEASGTVTLVTALAVGETLVIRRKPANTQPTSIRNLGEYFAGTHEDEFDLLVMQVQALQDQIDRSVKLKESIAGSAALVELEPETGKVVAGTGTAFTMSTLDSSAIALPGEGRTVATASAFLANNAVYHADDYLGVAADFGAVINFILTQVGKTAATIVIPNRSITFATAIDLTDSRAIRITGEQTGNPNSVTDWGPNLIWTGGAGSGSGVKAIGSVALEWDHVNLSYNNAAYNGKLFTLKSTGGAQNTSTPHIHHCRISGTPTAKLAAMLVELDITLALTIEQTTFDYAVVGIGCSAGSNNAIYIGEGVWFDKHFSDCCIKGWGNGWTIGEVVQECDPTGGVPLTPLFKLAGDSTVLAFRGCWSGDGGNGGGTIIDLDTGGFTAQGVDLQAVLGAHASGTFLKCSDTAGKTSGLNLHGSRIDAMAVGVHLGKSEGTVIRGNRIGCTTPWTGTAPTRYSVGNNDYADNDAACGVPVAQDADIAITPPGSANGGLGTVDITAKEDASHARFGLNGAIGTTTEIYDPTAHYSNAVGTASMNNVYYDAGTACYRLQNKRAAGTRTYVVTYSGR